VAQVLRPHGVRGDVRAEPLGGGPERFAPGMRVAVDDGRELTVRRARALAGGQVLLGFEGIDDPEHAAGLRHAYLSVDASQARPLADGEWFVWQLLGLSVRDPEGRELGTVADVEEGVASDLLVVSDRGSLRRFPMVAAFVQDVDVENGVVVLQPWDEEEA
jgi:16S rRNA processing protein RimM